MNEKLIEFTVTIPYKASESFSVMATSREDAVTKAYKQAADFSGKFYHDEVRVEANGLVVGKDDQVVTFKTEAGLVGFLSEAGGVLKGAHNLELRLIGKQLQRRQPFGHWRSGATEAASYEWTNCTEGEVAEVLGVALKWAED